MLKPLICLSILRTILALQPDTWEPISVGLMMQQRSLDSCPSEEHSRLMKRAHRQSRRDYKQTVGSIQRMDAGGILLPGERMDGSVNGQGSEVGKARDYHASMKDGNGTHAAGKGEQHHRDKREEGGGDSFMSVITWYTGSDLLDPSCITEGKWNPTDESMIAAVTLNWPNKPPCGSFLELRKTKKDPPATATPTPTGSNNGSNKPAPPPQPRVDSIIVRVMDSCAGCKAGVPHVDLTKAGFKSLYALDIGYVSDIEVKLLSKPPFEKWGKQEEMLYGPEKIGKSKSSKGSPTSKNNGDGGPSWTSSRDDSWTSKNTAPAWTPDASPRVLGGPTGSSQSNTNNNKEKSPKQSSASSSGNGDGNGKMSGTVNGGSGGGGPGGRGKKGSTESTEDSSGAQSQTSSQSDAWKENGWKWGS